jgi:hypothetical protein
MKAFRIDMSSSKLRKITKDETEYQDVLEILLENVPRLKEIYNH